MRKDAAAYVAPRIIRMMIVLAAMLPAACGNGNGERVAGGALMGGALGIPAGPIGIGVGAGVGAATGALLPKDVLEGNPQPVSR
jgi:hypothetical protein